MATISEKLDIVIKNQARHEVRLDNFAKDQTEHHESLYGKDGVVIEVDRLKGFRRLSCKLFAIFGTAIVVALIRFVFTHLSH